MSTSKVLATKHVSNLAELLSELHKLSVPGSPDDCIYVFGKAGENVRIRLIEDTLTDGSKVLNINLE